MRCMHIPNSGLLNSYWESETFVNLYTFWDLYMTFIIFLWMWRDQYGSRSDFPQADHFLHCKPLPKGWSPAAKLDHSYMVIYGHNTHIWYVHNNHPEWKREMIVCQNVKRLILQTAHARLLLSFYLQDTTCISKHRHKTIPMLHDWSQVCILHPQTQSVFTFTTTCMVRISVVCGFTSSMPKIMNLKFLVFKVKPYVKKSVKWNSSKPFFTDGNKGLREYSFIR